MFWVNLALTKKKTAHWIAKRSSKILKQNKTFTGPIKTQSVFLSSRIKYPANKNKF